MTRAAFVAQMLERYGEEAVCGGQKAPVVLRSLRPNDLQDSRSICTAPAEFCPREGTKLSCGGRLYTVLRCGGRYLKNRRLYTWAVLQQEGEEDCE
ncbi:MULTISPECIES: hypothetical protein [Caproicibacterium]|jgi:hypothetical protein|uniref:Uncharacterized protein n=1 Tax=Caproicibacterium lactatifermentans TaxID=2666138 RepID=A0A859DSZ1_9FIRM|nr:hypothetical protein [Caproicibacterium lactatifermentans]ARP49534.1 hypothetical protein B6259_00655 [Ruminococcaceae bacterium CPB6]MDD4807858.1 hypothetical protein [Oscillospiraceae bacterium]QKN23121.1 hypothetical protein GJQ69_00635 [Caproicibacterium lactatifermentans]QKO30273.1 hypothetical protein GKP14_04135 [Caproicibacterium lactatifermentans]